MKYDQYDEIEIFIQLKEVDLYKNGKLVAMGLPYISDSNHNSSYKEYYEELCGAKFHVTVDNHTINLKKK